MRPSPFILVAEDDPNDAFLFEHTFAGLGITNYFITRDGDETINYMRGEARYANRSEYPLPHCLVIDLKMPRVSGFEVLEWLRDHADHRLIPTIVFSGSAEDADINRAYDLGANTYFCKQRPIEEMIRVLSLIEEYWIEAKHPKLAANGRRTC
jgi:CheY-like chemotaxis protein